LPQLSSGPLGRNNAAFAQNVADPIQGNHHLAVSNIDVKCNTLNIEERIYASSNQTKQKADEGVSTGP
jgi:hypothetical protein